MEIYCKNLKHCVSHIVASIKQFKLLAFDGFHNQFCSKLIFKHHGGKPGIQLIYIPYTYCVHTAQLAIDYSVFLCRQQTSIWSTQWSGKQKGSASIQNYVFQVALDS